MIRRYQASQKTQDASKYDSEFVKDAVASLIGKPYFDVQRAAALVEAIQAQITLDENVLELARQRREAGVGTTLDVIVLKAV